MEAERTGFGVTLETQHNLRSTVPSSSNVFRHVPRILLRINRETSCQTKIANLKLAVGVHQKVAGLQVSVEHVGGVNIFQAAEDLVDEGLEVGVGEWLAGSDDCCEIAFHEFLVYVSSCLGIYGGCGYLPS